MFSAESQRVLRNVIVKARNYHNSYFPLLVKPKPGVVQVIKNLKEKYNCKIGMATSSERQWSRLRMRIIHEILTKSEILQTSVLRDGKN